MTDMPAEALALSVREDEPKEHLSTAMWWYSGRQGDLLHAYGDPQREVQLRQYWYAIHNTILQGAISGLIKRIVATPWEISGDHPRLTRRYQDVLQMAEFGRGWKSLVVRVMTDHYTQDGGGVIEIIGRGDKESPLRGPVMGLAHLDRHRCAFTGSIEHPVAYFPRRGGVIYLHRTRVHRMTDMESPDEDQFGNGFCALSRAIGITSAQILMGRYQNEKLGHEPPAGLIVFSNVKPDSVEDMRSRYDADRQKEGTNIYSPLQYIEGTDPDRPVQVQFIPFSQLPDHFDEQKFTEIHVNKVALALNDDPQEIWPLTGQAFQGTGTQTRILDAKGKAKALGDALAMWERFLNLFVLPEALEFKFKYRDREQDKQVADTAQVWAGVATQLLNNGQIDPEMANRLLANQVEAFADVLLDEAGNVRLPDDDKLPEEQTVVTDDRLPEEPSETEGEEVVVEDDTDAVAKMLDGWTWYVARATRSFTKDYMNTQAEFIRNLTDLFKGAMDGDISRRRAGTVLRAQLARLGTQAMKDGLADGGVEVEALDEDDQKIVAKWLAEQSRFVTNALNGIYHDGSTLDPEQRAILWAQKSLQGIYMEGVASADRNGLYLFTGKDGDESCSTCTKLKGQVHRMKDWVKRRLRPGVDTDNFDCGGWRCEHYLEKTEGRPRGRWPVSKAQEAELSRAA